MPSKMIGHECMETSVAIAEVEASEPRDPLLVSGCDPVEIVLEPCGEVVVDQLVEVPFEKLRHREGNERRHERGALLVDVAAVEDGPHDRGVRRRSADTAVLERPHEARFRVARGRARFVALRLERRSLEGLADRQRRQPALLVLVRRLVATRFVRLQEAGKRDDRSARAEGRRAVVGRRGSKLDRNGLTARVLHLGSDRPLEDEVVEGVLVTRELAAELVRRPEDVPGGPDRLVRFLRIGDRPLVPSGLGGHGLWPVDACCMRARRSERGVGQRHRVGSHVRDVAVLVEALGDAHRRLRREPQLAACLLLQRGRAERRRGSPRVGLLVDLLDGERPSRERVGQRSRAVLVEHQDGG